MNGVLGMTELLLGTPLDAGQRQFVEGVERSGQHLLGIINDILDFSKIEAGKLELETVDFDLLALLDDSAAMFASSAQQKGLELIVDLPAGQPLVLRGDPLRLRQVVANLLSNAVKFTEAGEIALRLAIQARDEQGVAFALSVSDSGIGIPPSAQKGIFEHFRQADGSTTRKYGGTGLGLAICRHLVEMMGGRIAVSSASARGSCFTVELRLPPGRLPAARPSARSPEAPARTAEPTRLRGRALVAEDNESNLLVVRAQLEKIGLEVVTVENGQEALDRMAGEAFDVVLMDCQMPVLDGFAATAAWRQREAGTDRHLPIVALTANAMKGDRERCLAAGMDAYLAKPYSGEDLLRTLAEWLPPERRHAHGPAGGRSDAPAAARRAPEALDRAAFDKIRALSPESADKLVRQVVEAFLKAARREWQRVDEGLAASDWAALGKAAHALKSSSFNVGALAFAETCRACEEQCRAGSVAAFPAPVEAMRAEWQRAEAALRQILAELPA